MPAIRAGDGVPSCAFIRPEDTAVGVKGDDLAGRCELTRAGLYHVDSPRAETLLFITPMCLCCFKLLATLAFARFSALTFIVEPSS